MTSLVLEALPVGIAVTALGAAAFVITGLLALDFFTSDHKKRPRPCQARAHDPSRRYTG